MLCRWRKTVRRAVQYNELCGKSMFIIFARTHTRYMDLTTIIVIIRVKDRCFRFIESHVVMVVVTGGSALCANGNVLSADDATHGGTEVVTSCETTTTTNNRGVGITQGLRHVQAVHKHRAAIFSG